MRYGIPVTEYGANIGKQTDAQAPLPTPEKRDKRYSRYTRRVRAIRHQRHLLQKAELPIRRRFCR